LFRLSLMDTFIALLVDQFQRGLAAESWHGPNLMHLLDRVTPEQATMRPVESYKTIAELARHIAAWQRIAAARFRGERFDIDESMDWPTTPARLDDDGWTAIREEVRATADEWRAALQKESPESLVRPIAPSNLPAHVFIAGVLQHNAYHGGQVALLWRLVK